MLSGRTNSKEEAKIDEWYIPENVAFNNTYKKSIFILNSF